MISIDRSLKAIIKLRLCYTELVYDRINRKLGFHLSPEVLIDSVNRPVETARTVLKEISKETLHAMPGGRANSIAWLVWHSARQMDIQVAWLDNATTDRKSVV